MDRIDGNPNPLDFASGSAVPVAQDAPVRFAKQWDRLMTVTRANDPAAAFNEVATKDQQHGSDHYPTRRGAGKFMNNSGQKRRL